MSLIFSKACKQQQLETLRGREGEGERREERKGEGQRWRGGEGRRRGAEERGGGEGGRGGGGEWGGGGGRRREGEGEGEGEGEESQRGVQSKFWMFDNNKNTACIIMSQQNDNEVYNIRVSRVRRYGLHHLNYIML